MMLPPEVPHGRPMHELTQALNLLIRYCRSITPRPSATVGVETFSNGTTFRAKPPVAPSSGGRQSLPDNMSFKAEVRTGTNEGDDYIEVRMLGGTVQGLFGAIEFIPTTFWTSDESPRDLALFDDFNEDAGDVKNVHDGIADGDLFWLKYDPSETEGQRWSMEHGATLPQSSNEEPEEEEEESPDEVRYFTIIPLFQLRGEGVIQGHLGAIYVPTVKNIVDVQTTDAAASDPGQENNGGGSGGEE